MFVQVNLPVSIDVDLYTLRLLLLSKACSKVRYSVFATHCTVDTLDVVHTGGHAVTVFEIYGVTQSTTFSSIVRTLQRKCKRKLDQYWCARWT